MMIDKRLIGMMGDSKRYIAKNVALQWLALAANVAMIFAVSRYLGALYDQLTIGDTMAGAPNLPLTLGIVAAALLVGFAISLLWSESKLVELNDQIQDAKAQLVSEQSQYTYYNSTLNSKTNITSVEETAGRLGLMKIDQSQITYIRLGESDTLERTQSAVRQWTDFIYNGAVNILGTVK